MANMKLKLKVRQILIDHIDENRLSKTGCKLLHEMLWNWLAKAPTKSKHDWPGWDVCREYKITHVTNCFACLYTAKRTCDSCPCKDACSDEFKIWHKSKDLAERKRLALVIANSWR